MCAGAYTFLSLPLSAAIALHEIHLARQSSLQVPVGHIPVPGGIKLCSPGTFWVANYLIINNGSCQVNFTKPISATIRCTNSQWLRDAATEVPVEGVPVPEICQKTPFATRGWLWSTCGHGRRAEDLSEAPFATPECLWSTCGHGSRAKDRPEDPLRHAGMPLEYLWGWSPCRRPVGRLPLPGPPLGHLPGLLSGPPPAPPAQSPARSSSRSSSRPAIHPPRPALPSSRRLCFLARRTTVGPVTLSIS